MHSTANLVYGWVACKYRRKAEEPGEATKALKMLADAADKLRVQINLFVQPMDKATHVDGLIATNKRFGFNRRSYDGMLYMVRKPKQKQRPTVIKSPSRKISVAGINHVVVLV